ncbi:response regulator [Caballeronia sp. LZ062]|uniref:response regulator n=1 Tax=unclassified Caballeronia TaxID=2646786 RepID=UPI00285FEE8A|nr:MULTISPECIES: response regulator [unclassified Caballeronia]MDR5857707.1 response regulator [Caballeronia sp. LZ050]MDR5869257.1 response regulator [Caballeronia sp. LZ062]
MKDEKPAKHVLIVDDEVAIAYVFQRYFELRGFQVSAAYDGGSALAIGQSEAIDALVTDFRMPGMNGLELIDRLRQTAPCLPAVIVSGFSSEIGAGLPGVRVLGKPVEPTHVVEAVREMLADADTVRSLKGADG